MADFLAFCIFLPMGSYCGKALARFDRATFSRTETLGGYVFLVFRTVVVSGALLGIGFGVGKLDVDAFGQRDTLMLGVMAANYVTGIFRIQSGMRVKVWK